MAGSTGMGFAAASQSVDSKTVTDQLNKIWNTYVSKYLQNSGWQGGNQNPPQAKPPQSKPQNPQVNSSKATEILNLVNKERAEAGLPALKSDPQVSKLAQMKAEDMAKNKYFAHNSPTYGSAFDMMNKYGVSYRTAGENIAKGQKTSQSVMNGWMNSPGHRANILKNGYTRLGVGYTVDASGTTYWVQMFVG